MFGPSPNIQAYINPDWNSVLVTPPFPESTSGHSLQSGALAKIMTDLFGENYTFADTTHDCRIDIDGSAHTYASFMYWQRSLFLDCTVVFIPWWSLTAAWSKATKLGVM